MIGSGDITLMKMMFRLINSREYKKLATRYRLLQRVKRLVESITYPPSPAMMLEYEAINSICVEITKYAERKCRKLRMG
jgi:hypothetical protein